MECAECGYPRDSWEHRSGLNGVHEPGTKTRKATRPAGCPLCSEYFPTRMALGRHTKAEHGMSLDEAREK